MASDFSSTSLPISPTAFFGTEDMEAMRLSDWEDILEAIRDLIAHCIHNPYTKIKAKPGWAIVSSVGHPESPLAKSRGQIIVAFWPVNSRVDMAYGKDAFAETDTALAGTS